ncbi:MAG: hypothetical protein ACRD3M_13605, partial [Thermoanaerobaculia bacterium]
AGSSPQRPPTARRTPAPALPARPGAWLALSSNPSRIPFAGAPLSSDFRLPPEIARRLSPGLWYLCVFREADGRVLETVAWEKEA